MSNGDRIAGTGTAEVYAHKLFVPRGQSGAIRRGALLERVLRDQDRRIVVLQAPAGHGKTTLLQQFAGECENEGYVTSWLGFDSSDNDVRRGFSHIYAAVACLNDGKAAFGEVIPPDTGPHSRADWVAERLTQLRRPAALFFDEFQTLEEPTLFKFFYKLLNHIPDNIRIFIGSRALPPLGLSRLIVNNKAILLRADDLRFTPEEVAQFFSVRADLEISEEEVRAIYTRTEGWPAALQLYRLSLGSPHVRQSLCTLDNYQPRELAEYLVENVLSLQSPEIQSFLLQTAFLNRLTGPLCDAVTGRADSSLVLRDLERSGLFLRSQDSDRRWFSYHGLFASSLRDASGPAAAPAVHRRAAQWYREADMAEDAVVHFIAAGDFEDAAQTMDSWAGHLVACAHLVTVERWADQIPFDTITRHPDLAIKIAYALVFLRRFRKVEPLLAFLKALPCEGDRATSRDIMLAIASCCLDDIEAGYERIQRVSFDHRNQNAFAALGNASGANLWALCEIAKGNFARAHDYLALAHSISDQGAASFSDGYACGLAGVISALEGQLSIALERFRVGLAQGNMQLEGSVASAALMACNIWVRYEANELDIVESLFSHYHDRIAKSVLPDFLTVAFLSMARTHDARGRREKGGELLDEMEQIALSNGWERLSRIVQWERVRRWLLAGDHDRAVGIAARLPIVSRGADAGWRHFSEEIGGETLARIRLLIHTGEHGAASSMLSQEANMHRDRVSMRIKLYLLDALLHQARGQQNAAHRILRKALQLAQPGQMIRSILDEGEGILRLLREEYQAILDNQSGRPGEFGTDRSFIEAILQASGTDLSRTGAAPEPLEELTDREREILLFLANGVSNRQMADRIFISENTVKFHLKNIYSKLAVSNRLQAVTTARHLGIVH